MSLNNNIPHLVRLSNGEWWELPEGADPQTAIRYKEAQIKTKASPKKRKPSRRPSGRSTRSKQFASTCHALSFRLEQVNKKRQAPPPVDEIPFNGEPTTQADDVTRNWGDWLEAPNVF